MQIRSTCAGQKPAVSQGAAETNATDFGGALGEKLSKSDKIYIQNAIEIILITHHDVQIAQAEQEIFGKDRSRCKAILSAAKCFPLSFLKTSTREIYINLNIHTHHFFPAMHLGRKVCNTAATA